MEVSPRVPSGSLLSAVPCVDCFPSSSHIRTPLWVLPGITLYNPQMFELGFVPRVNSTYGCHTEEQGSQNSNPGLSDSKAHTPNLHPALCVTRKVVPVYMLVCCCRQT